MDSNVSPDKKGVQISLQKERKNKTKHNKKIPVTDCLLFQATGHDAGRGGRC